MEVTKKSSQSSNQEDLYGQYREAYEKHERLVWDREKILRDLSLAGNDNNIILQKNQEIDKISNLTSEALQNIEKLLLQLKFSIGDEKTFFNDPIDDDGVGKTLKKRIDRELLNFPDLKYKESIKTALLSLFLDKEKISKNSIYRKRLKKGFSAPIDLLIEEEKQQNAEFRKEMLQKYQKHLSEEEVKLIDYSFRRHMARHGMPVIG